MKPPSIIEDAPLFSRSPHFPIAGLNRKQREQQQEHNLKIIAVDFETANEQRGSACSVGLAWIKMAPLRVSSNA